MGGQSLPGSHHRKSIFVETLFYGGKSAGAPKGRDMERP